MIRRIAAALVLIVATASPAAMAKKVFLNGVDITSVRNQTFVKAKVTIDKEGNILIDAPGYKVEVIDPNKTESASTAPTAPAPTPEPADSKGGPNPSLQKKYFLVTQPSPDGKAQYNFTIFVNGIERKTIKAKDGQIIMEISAWLHKGQNEINIKAKKDLTTGRKSSKLEDEARIIVGIGHEEGKKVVIDAVKASVKANASQLSTIDKHFVLTAQ